MKNNSNKSDREQHLDYIKKEVQHSDNIAMSIFHKYKSGYSIKLIYSRQSNYIIDYLKKHNVYKLCDLGCGFGNFLIHAKISFAQVYGVDPGPESLKIAKQLVPDADLRMGSGEKMPFEDNELDAVVMKGVVHHLKDPHLTFREVFRCLKLDGILLIFEGNRSSLYRRIVLGIADFFRINHETTLFEHRAPKVMKQMLKKEGFTIYDCKNISGLFTPLALTGFGGLRIWKFLIAIEDILQRRCPFLFNYHVMLTAKKQLPVQTRR